MTSQIMQLFHNKIDLIKERDFLSKEQIASFLQALKAHPGWKPVGEQSQFNEDVNKETAKVMHLFRSQYMESSANINEENYLKNCAGYAKIWHEITEQCHFDPYLLLKKYFWDQYQLDLQVANKNGREYCPAVARDLSAEVLPHADYGPYDGKGWVIDQVEAQLAWNIYLTAPESGGETMIYDYVWDENLMLTEGTYGVKGFNKPIRATFTVTPGHLVIFNSRNFHSVAKSKGERIAIGGLIGKTLDNRFIAWS